MLTVVDLGQLRVSRPWLRSFDGIHFTSVGYKVSAYIYVCVLSLCI